MTLWIRDFKAKSGRDLGMKVRTGIGMPVTESTPDNSNLALTPVQTIDFPWILGSITSHCSGK